MNNNEKILNFSKDINEFSAQELAFIGDAVYEILVRCAIVESYSANIGILNEIKVKNVCCTAQSDLYEKIKDRLTSQESEVFKRGRNAHTGSIPKSASPCIYHRATGIEALFGFLYLSGKISRLQEFINELKL